MTHHTIRTPDGEKIVVNAMEMHFPNIEAIDNAVNDGRVYAEMTHGNFWRVRRNGATKRWKREPNRFRIPVKAGLRAYGAIEPNNLNHFWVVDKLL